MGACAWPAWLRPQSPNGRHAALCIARCTKARQQGRQRPARNHRMRQVSSRDTAASGPRRAHSPTAARMALAASPRRHQRHLRPMRCWALRWLITGSTAAPRRSWRLIGGCHAPFLAGARRRVVAAVALVREDARDGIADQRLHLPGSRLPGCGRQRDCPAAP
jgi:hypothetical protein